MEKIRKNKGKIIAGLIIIALLVFTFWYGGKAPGTRGFIVNENIKNQVESTGEIVSDSAIEEKLPEKAVVATEKEEQIKATEKKEHLSATEKEELAAELAKKKGLTGQTVEAGNADYSKSKGMEFDSKTGKDKYLTDPVPEGKPIPVEPQDVQIGNTAYSCTISISCGTILDNKKWLDPEKEELVPEDGWILKPVKVTFYEGESVFNVLLRTCKQKKIHMEYRDTPIYNSAYIEGIHNLYEFDCGELSGWMYSVDGWFPNYGCSRYQLKDGEVIKWVYTCDLGYDVGGGWAVGK